MWILLVNSFNPVQDELCDASVSVPARSSNAQKPAGVSSAHTHQKHALFILRLILLGLVSHNFMPGSDSRLRVPGAVRSRTSNKLPNVRASGTSGFVDLLHSVANNSEEVFTWKN